MFAYLSPAGAGPTLVPSIIIVNAGKIVVPLNWNSVAVCNVAGVPLSDYFCLC
jgi:hypothetical protein